MKGLCTHCLEEQAKGMADYTCPLCALSLTGTEPCLSRTPEGTVVIDLGKLFEK